MSDESSQEVGEEYFSEEESENEVREGDEIGAGNELGEEEESFPVENGTETTSEPSSNKRIKEMSIDRLSALPDSLLIHILSFLDMKKAAITCVLSKRWQFLWTNLPRLEFRESTSEIEKICRFVTRVHRALVFRSGNYLEKFEVNFNYNECFASDVNVWVEFAVKNKVKKVTLTLDSYEDFYTLPQMMYSNSSLTSLSVQGCIVAPRRIIDWRSLTSLEIEEVEVPQIVLEKILSGCPVLGRLELRECWGFHCLEANSQNLYKLGVLDCEDGNSEPLLKISAPYVRALDISLYPKGRKFQLTSIPSVVTAYVRLCGSDYDSSSVEVMNNAKELLENILHVEELELGWCGFEILAKLVVNGWQLPQSRLRSLLVTASRDEEGFSGIIGLLESSPNLEELFVHCHGAYWDSGTWAPARDDLVCDLLHLKNVYLTDYAERDHGGEPMLTMARILLKRAMVLEKMNIEFSKFPSKSSTDFIKITQALLSYPRSSHKALVLLHQ